MDPTVLTGLIGGTSLLIYAMGLDNVMALFIDPNSLIIVLGGTSAATIIHFPLTQLNKVFVWSPIITLISSILAFIPIAII